MDSLTSFSFFPLLSPELRLQIWHEALLFPRLVLLWKDNRGPSSQLGRSVGARNPLLYVNRESRCEALRIYSSATSPSLLESPNAADIIYIFGMDGDRRAFKNVTWTCEVLSQEIESAFPSVASPRRLAVDEEFLQQTPFLHFSKIPYSIWKLIVSDLHDLEELIVVRRGAKIPWTVGEVQKKLVEAKEKFLCFWQETCADEIECQILMKWRMPVVRIVSPEELHGMCWR